MASASGLSVNNFVSTAGLPAGSQPVKVAVIEALGDAPRSINWADSGKIFTLGTVTAARTITLPAVAASVGLNFRVLVTVAPGGNVVTFQAPVGTMAGSIQSAVSNADPGVATVNAVGNAAKRSVVTAANTPVGASADFICDGVSWHVRAFGGSANGAAVWAFA